jgi:tRNA/tmRNA/rRNA uracil-C5-methylase (TrmA/RlmC/RlmD family)
MELRTGAMAAGGGCVARADDGRVVFVRHALPGERVLAQVTGETSSYLRADATEILEPSPDRVAPPCPHAGAGRCGGCDWQHVSLPAQRGLKVRLVEEQLRRLAGDHRPVEVEEVLADADADADADGLGWRTRVRFAVDRSGQLGFYRHRSHDVEVVERCLIAAPLVDGTGATIHRWRGARSVEVLTSAAGGQPVVAVDTGRRRLADRPTLAAGRVVNGRTEREPHGLICHVLGRRYRVSAGVFWQVHPQAADLLASTVLDGLAPQPGEHALDLYAGAGLFSTQLARAVGPGGSVLAVERSGRACSDAVHNAADQPQVTVRRAEVTPQLVADEVGTPDLVVLDPAREGAGQATMEALVGLDPAPRVAYVACDPASFARDLRVALDAGWSMPTLRAFDLFPMTEHVELVGFLYPPVPPVPAAPGSVRGAQPIRTTEESGGSRDDWPTEKR